MTFLESLLVLLAIALCLLQISRRLSIPYPTLLASAGVILALVPGTPKIALEPVTALTLFIAPAIFDAAFEFPLGAIRQLWKPLLAVAFAAVLFTAAAVAWLGVHVAGLPLFAAIALGAIVAPPDAVAATAVLRTVRMPRRAVAILKGESLLNDATALLLFGVAVGTFQHDAGAGQWWAFQSVEAVPGGLLLGFAMARLLSYLLRFFAGLLSAYLLEYLFTFGAWILAVHLELSAVLCVVAFAMTLARGAGLVIPPRIRLHNAAVSHTLVFLLNVLAFLLMGFQAQSIVSVMSPERLRESVWFAADVVACVIVVRMVWVLLYNRLAYRFSWLRGNYTPSTLRQGVLLGWCGMRGLVTLATAIALPATFPQRDLIVLTAFGVVLATLVVQGLTVAPLVRILGLDGEDGLVEELTQARADLASVAFEALTDEPGVVADHWRFEFGEIQWSVAPGKDPTLLRDWRRLGLLAVQEQRKRLEWLHVRHRVGPEVYALLQEDIDFFEVALSSECARRIEES
jgi:CPA1 family monovalent cation:H+ antiporter